MADETPVFMRTVVSKLNFFLELLKNPQVSIAVFYAKRSYLLNTMEKSSQDPSKSFQMTYGKLSPPFGFLRVKILEFLSALLNTRYQSIVDSFWKTEPNVFNTLFVRHPRFYAIHLFACARMLTACCT